VVCVVCVGGWCVHHGGAADARFWEEVAFWTGLGGMLDGGVGV